MTLIYKTKIDFHNFMKDFNCVKHSHLNSDGYPYSSHKNIKDYLILDYPSNYSNELCIILKTTTNTHEILLYTKRQDFKFPQAKRFIFEYNLNEMNSILNEIKNEKLWRFGLSLIEKNGKYGLSFSSKSRTFGNILGPNILFSDEVFNFD